jgi:hypothetical protein
MRSPILSIPGLLLFLAALLHNSSLASERIFTYTYQSNVLAKGQKEIEIWNTLHWQREDFYRKFLHRVEFEIGLGGNVQTAFYLNVQSVAAFEPGPSPSIEKELEVGFSNEWKFTLSDPVADALGSAGYLELGILADELELEGKLILDKQIGNTTHALNIVGEPAWGVAVESGGTKTEFELGLEFDYGFSCELNENWNLGFEARNHNDYTKGNGWQHSALFAGPVISYRTSGWWVTLTILPQLYAFNTEAGNKNSHLELRAHERIETRLLFSYEL